MDKENILSSGNVERNRRKALLSYHKRKSEGKIKGINELTAEEQQAKRKKWRESQDRRRKNKMISSNTSDGNQCTETERSPMSDITANTGRVVLLTESLPTSEKNFRSQRANRREFSPENAPTENSALQNLSALTMQADEKAEIISDQDMNNNSFFDLSECNSTLQDHSESVLAIPTRQSSRKRKIKSLDCNFLYGEAAQRKKRTVKLPETSIAQPSEKNTESILQSHKIESRQKQQGRKAKHRHSSQQYRQLQKLEQQLHEKTKEAEKYKKRFFRLKSDSVNKNSAKAKVKCLVGNRIIPDDVKDVLEENFALKEDLKESIQSITSNKEKACFVNALKFDNLKASKLMEKGTQFLPKGVKHKLRRKRINPNASHTLKQKLIKDYWLSDIASTECPGKKQTLTIQKKKHQLRYMNASRKRIYKLFKKKHPGIGYTAFCKHKPKWIVQAKVSARDTCLCTTCENIKLKVEALHKLDVIQEAKIDSVVDSLCCESGQVECLLRHCNACKDKSVKFNEFPKTKSVDYEQWMSVQEERTNARTKQKFTVKRTVLQTVTCQLHQLVKLTSKDIITYSKHIGRHYHQYQAFKNKIENLPDNVVVLRIDYSEKWATKYKKEVQGVHFGASRELITIHTGMLYTKNSKQAFSTVSDHSSQDALATMVHLKPILTPLLEENPQINEVMIISDSPSTQYRNKTIFGLIIQHFATDYPQIQNFSWNYSEAGHGKGPHDGVGAVIKRTADELLMSGLKVDTFDKFLSEMVKKENVENVNIISVSGTNIDNFKETYQGQDIKFEGTMKVHQVTWCRSDPFSLKFRELSCFQCDLMSDCKHFHLGSKKMNTQANPSTSNTAQSSQSRRKRASKEALNAAKAKQIRANPSRACRRPK